MILVKQEFSTIHKDGFYYQKVILHYIEDVNSGGNGTVPNSAVPNCAKIEIVVLLLAFFVQLITVINLL